MLGISLRSGAHLNCRYLLCHLFCSVERVLDQTKVIKGLQLLTGIQLTITD